jgi:UDP-3-O-[3-hydroxymyristoyl] glucosamine N-acyltransferase
MLVRDIAAMLEVPWEGDGELEIRRVADLDSAHADEISFVGNRKAAATAHRSSAGCLLVPLNFENESRRTVVRTSEPRVAIVSVIHRLHPPARPQPGIHATAVIGRDVVFGELVSVGAHAVIGDHVRIGDHSIIHPNVTIYHHVSIGRRAVLHSGAVIGADGFGFILRDGAYENFPQVGSVEIGDDVEIGTKLDNMVHIGHNCSIGRHVVIAAQTGLAGGVVIADYAVIGGQVGIGDKARIESRAVLGSGAGVLTSKIVRGGQVFWGTPARPLKEHLEQLAVLAKLPEIRKEWLELKQKLGRREGL